MPDESEKSEGVSQDEVKSLVSGLIDKVTGSDKGSGTSPSTSTAPSSFPVALILAGIAVIGFAIMGFMLMRAKRKAAKLASELRKKEEEHIQAKEAEQLAETAEARAMAEAQVKALDTETKALVTEIEVLKEQNDTRRKTIADLANWDDLVVVDKR